MAELMLAALDRILERERIEAALEAAYVGRSARDQVICDALETAWAGPDRLAVTVPRPTFAEWSASV